MKVAALVLIQFLLVPVFAQEKLQPVVSIHENTWDFGRVMEDGGQVIHRFEIINSGSYPLRISHVRTTCGCTIPSWTKEPILPDQEGYVEVAFDPAGRSGDFHKTIQVQSNAENANMFVSISGTVVPALHEEELHYTIGGLAIKADQLNLGYLYKGNMGKEYLTIRNMTDAVMEIDFDNVPEHIVLYAHPRQLNPGQYGQIEVSYCTEKTEDWDVVIDEVTLIQNGQAIENKKLSVIANIREDFRGLSPEQLEEAPVAFYTNDIITLDTISTELPRACRFMISNNGSSDLKIRAVKASCGCTVVTPEKNVLVPGDSTWIDAVFDPGGRSGAFRNGITVVTNDPVHYKKFLYVEGFVQEQDE